MADEQQDLKRRNLPVLAGQSILSQVAWTLGSPSVVLPFLAVSLEVPMFLAGALVSVRMVGSMISDVFLAQPIAAQRRKKRGIALTEIAIGCCLFMAILIASVGHVPLTAVAFVAAFFLIGLIEEGQALMFSDVMGDHLSSKARMVVNYLQLGVGGLGAIGIALLVHQITKDNPPFSRHSTVIAVSIAFFSLSALCILAMAERAVDQDKENAAPKSRRTLRQVVGGIVGMFEYPWFRRYMVMRLPLVAVTLSVPFFALIAAEAHHTSAKGLTAMIVSSASGYLVSAPLWQFINLKSHRAVMVTGTLMVAVTGIVLLAFHYLHIDHQVHLHAVALFVVSVAVTGVGSARKLYFLDVAPKDQRIQGAAAVKSICRLVGVVLSAALAAVAHTNEVALAIVFIVLVSLWASFACFWIVDPKASKAV
ncbi:MULTISPECIES: permease [unclassified Ruegeria]|uniref:permease n=1 Tax=unclassified Ruegeria TaxID=2625375 RepID=UPI001488A330|nr:MULTISPECIES: permease [unclassified Ruegeria]